MAAITTLAELERIYGGAGAVGEASTAKVADHVTPDNSKSTTEKVKDTVTGTTDKVQR